MGEDDCALARCEAVAKTSPVRRAYLEIRMALNLPLLAI